MNGQIITIKIGGAPAGDENLIRSLASEMKSYSDSIRFIVIHGGGAEVTELSRRFGIEPVFQDGLRVTSKEEMKIVDKVLSGLINKRLVRIFQTCGFNAVGLSGSDGKLFVSKSSGECNGCPSHTGVIEKVRPGLVELLLAHNYLPVIASTSMDEDGLPLNINADDVAFNLSTEMKVSGIVFFSDIPGILKNGALLKRLSPDEVKAELSAGTIKGGMIPKVKASMEALEKGVGKIIIGDYTGSGSLKQLLSGERGTEIGH
jgi:acetylglutamate kinase